MNEPVIEVDFQSNVAQALSELKQKTLAALKAIGTTAEGYAKANCPVDTGRLRNSITNAVYDNEVYIGTNVVYAPMQEFYDMNHKVGQAHFLRDAAATHGDEYRELTEAAMED